MASTELQIELEKSEQERKVRSIKVMVWDLDNTIWDGILLEDRTVAVIPRVVEVIKECDRRGILQSIASRNDHDSAFARLRELGLAEYFLYPQINWGTKSESVR